MSFRTNCIIYFCDEDSDPTTKPTRFASRYQRVLSDRHGSPSECLWMFPTWEAFEQASA